MTWMYATCTLVFILLLPVLLRRLLIVNDPARKVDAILVLGYPAREDGSISGIAQNRIEKAVQLYRDGFAPVILISGGAVQNKHCEAQVMQSHAVLKGIPIQDIQVECKSKDTYSNLKNCLVMINKRSWSSVAIVTSEYHTRRVSILNHAFFQLNAIIIASDYPRTTGWFERVKMIYYEFGLLLVTTLFPRLLTKRQKEI